jgi:Mce-associated membrane protein
MTTMETEEHAASVEAEQEAAIVDEPRHSARRINWSRVLVYGVLPGLALLLAMTAGFLKWQYATNVGDDTARAESVQAAKNSTVALLSYHPDTVEQQLGAARDLTTGEFRNSYTQLTNEVVIPGARQKQISAVATIPAAASVSASDNHAVVMVFVNQTTTIGRDAPTQSTSSIRVTMDKVDGRWLISQFDPM